MVTLMSMTRASNLSSSTLRRRPCTLYTVDPTYLTRRGPLTPPLQVKLAVEQNAWKTSLCAKGDTLRYFIEEGRMVS
jgi:hypothetical protein